MLASPSISKQCVCKRRTASTLSHQCVQIGACVFDVFAALLQETARRLCNERRFDWTVGEESPLWNSKCNWQANVAPALGELCHTQDRRTHNGTHPQERQAYRSASKLNRQSYQQFQHHPTKTACRPVLGSKRLAKYLCAYLPKNQSPHRNAASASR